MLLAFIGVIAAEGIIANKAINASLKTVYEDRTVPLVQLAEMVDLLSDIREAVSVLQVNASASEKAAAESAITKTTIEITELWKAYMATYLTPEEKKLAAVAAKAKDVYMAAARDSVANARREPAGAANNQNIDVLKKQFSDVNDSFDDLKQLQADVAKEEFELRRRVTIFLELSSADQSEPLCN